MPAFARTFWNHIMQRTWVLHVSVLWGEVACSLLQPLNAAKWWVSTRIFYHVLSILIFQEGRYILPRSNTGSCGCTSTPFKETLFSRMLCVFFLSFLATLIFFLISLISMYGEGSQQIAVLHLFFRFGDETSAHLTHASSALRLHFFYKLGWGRG